MAITTLLVVGTIAVVVTAVSCAFAWYRIVDPSKAHLVATPKGTFVASSDDKVGTKRTYYAIPSGIPVFGRTIRIMDLTIKEIGFEQETIEKNQARFMIKSSTKYRIKNVRVAAETFTTNPEVEEQLKEIIRAGTRAITVQYDVVDARAKKQEIEAKIREEIVDDLQKWGLELINFQLVEFRDTPESHIISNISKRSEVEIEARTREQNAEKLKQARIKEAEAEEKSRQREIEKDRVIGEQEELKKQKIAVAEKEAEEKRYAVVEVQTIRQAEIDKLEAIVKANENKETEAINKEQKLLEGQGDRAKAEEKAKGDAAPILEKGLAEAKAKDALQQALNKFGTAAIQALVAEKVVEMQKEVGIAGAKALEKADMRIFAGSDNGKGFDVGKALSAVAVGNDDMASATFNRLARPNDMGLTTLGVKAVAEDVVVAEKRALKRLADLNLKTKEEPEHPFESDKIKRNTKRPKYT